MTAGWRRRALVRCGVAVGLVAAQLGTVPPAAAQSAPPVLVEDYGYPGAARILAERGIKVVSGDGHVLLVECGTVPDAVRVQSRSTSEVCFDISGPVGYIAMDIPEVYLIRTDEHAIQATMESSGEVRTVDLRPNEWNPVGEGVDPDRPAALLSLSARPVGGGDLVLPVDTTHPFVGRVEFGQAGNSGGMSRGCTATLVAPAWVLSASSCFAPDPERPLLNAGAPTRPTTVTFGGQAPVAVTHLQPRTGRDLVLARLAGSVKGIAPARLATAAPTVSTVLGNAGYGRSGTVWRADTQTKGQLTVSGLTTTTLLGTTGSAGLCKGQTGGPAFTSTGHLVAVHTRAGQAGCLDSAATRTDTIATRVDNVATWITETIATPGAFDTYNVEVTDTNGAKVVFWRGSDNALWHKWQLPGGGWSPDTSLGGLMFGSPAVAVHPDGRLVAFVVGHDFQLFHKWQHCDACGWSDWVQLDCCLSANPAVVLKSDNALVAFGKGNDHAIWFRYQVPGGWSPWESLGHPGTEFSSYPTAGRFQDDRLWVKAWDKQGVEWTMHQELGTWRWSPWQ